jgi:hypothetical protein
MCEEFVTYDQVSSLGVASGSIFLCYFFLMVLVTSGDRYDFLPRLFVTFT